MLVIELKKWKKKISEKFLEKETLMPGRLNSFTTMVLEGVDYWANTRRR